MIEKIKDMKYLYKYICGGFINPQLPQLYLFRLSVYLSGGVGKGFHQSRFLEKPHLLFFK